MGVLYWLRRIFCLIGRAFTSLIISIIITVGTLVAAYLDFTKGMAIFWVGCICTLAFQSLRMYGMRHGVKNEARVYMGSALSIIINVVLGYGGAYVVYVYSISIRASDPLMELLLPERAPFVFALTAAVYATLQILLAVMRALLAFKFSLSRGPGHS